MYNDDFNDVKINNEKDGFSSYEFGNVQDSEFTFFNDNKAKSNTELNEKEDTSEKSNEESNKKEKKVESQNKIDTNLTSQSSLTSSVASSASAGGIVASASAVTVATLSTVVGINVIMSTKCNINNLDVTPVSVDYDLNVADSNNDLVTINLENKENNFLESQDLNEGKNVGSFDGLLPSCEYTLTVIDKKYDQILYEEKVTTLEIYDMSLDINPEVEYKDEFFNVKLNFSGDFSFVSEIYLYISNENKGTKKYQLEKTLDSQKVRMNSSSDKISFSFFDDFKYYISYVYKEKSYSSETKNLKFMMSKPDTASFKLNKFNVEYVEQADKVIAFKIDISDPDDLYSNPRIRLNKVDITGGSSSLNPVEVGIVELDEAKKDFQRLSFPSLDTNEKFYQYQLICFDNVNRGDVIIDTRSFNLDHKKRQGLVDFSLNSKYYILNSVPFVPIYLHLRDFDKAYGRIIFRYKLEGEESNKDSYLSFSSYRQGTISMRLDLNKQTPDSVTIESYQIIPVNHYNVEMEPIYTCNTPTTLIRANEAEIFGADIDYRISLSNPELTISFANNIQNDVEMGMELYFADANPPTSYSKFSFSFKPTPLQYSETKYAVDESHTVMLNSQSQLQDDPEKYNNLIKYIKTMPVVLMLNYTINGVDKSIVLSPMIYFDLI